MTGGNASSRSQANFAIVDNGTPTDPIANTQTAISNFANGYATASSRIAGNVLAPANSLGFRGIDGGVRPNVSGVNHTPEPSATVSGNTISRTDGNGILFTARAMSGTLRTKILNNIVAAPLSGVRPGIRVDSGNNIAGANPTVCLSVTGNTAAGSGGAVGIGVRKEGTDPAVNAFGIAGVTPSPPTNANVVSFITTLNPSGGGAFIINGSGFVNCSLP